MQSDTFNSTLAASLLPQVVKLAQQAALSEQPSPEDPDSRLVKIQLGHQVRIYDSVHLLLEARY